MDNPNDNDERRQGRFPPNAGGDGDVPDEIGERDDGRVDGADGEDEEAGQPNPQVAGQPVPVFGMEYIMAWAVYILQWLKDKWIPCTVLLAALLVATSFNGPCSKEIMTFHQFKDKFGKAYTTDVAEMLAAKHFQVSERRVCWNNHKYAQGRVSHWLQINEHADLNLRVFSSKRNGLRRQPNTVQPSTIDDDRDDDDDQFDWRDYGKVSRVRDQGNCQACWAFSAMAAVESQLLLRNESEVMISVQHLISCNRKEEGCEGGDNCRAMQWLKDHKGAYAEKLYPYVSGRTGKNGTCHSVWGSWMWPRKIKGYVSLTMPTDKTTLKKFLRNNGPLSVGVDAERWDSLYAGGTMKFRPRTKVNHAVLLVGWGKNANGRFWTIKNSWGTSWGMGGYGHLAMGTLDSGITRDTACFPLL